ncbi:MAG: hypothetical protein A2163_07835 [Actinobacteria bacterium RBG_13_35_12]|nr:MAG: hypothetical protein A2163_07835 [Actinobacteria bacterium RBG_13_35_12]
MEEIYLNKWMASLRDLAKKLKDYFNQGIQRVANTPKAEFFLPTSTKGLLPQLTKAQQFLESPRPIRIPEIPQVSQQLPKYKRYPLQAARLGGNLGIDITNIIGGGIFNPMLDISTGMGLATRGQNIQYGQAKSAPFKFGLGVASSFSPQLQKDFGTQKVNLSELTKQAANTLLPMAYVATGGKTKGIFEAGKIGTTALKPTFKEVVKTGIKNIPTTAKHFATFGGLHGLGNKDDLSLEERIKRGAGQAVLSAAISPVFSVGMPVAGYGIGKAGEVITKRGVGLEPGFAKIPGEEKQKGFLKTVQESEKTAKFIKKEVERLKQTYKVIPNKQSIATADKIIKENPDFAKERVLSIEGISAEKGALAVRLAKHYEKQKNSDAAIEIINAYDKQLRASGQFIQAASLWNKLSPESVVRAANKVGEKVDRPLDKQTQKIILDRMIAIQKLTGTKKEAETLKLLNYIAEKMPLKPIELFEAYRYQNMLSGLQTQERNIFFNMGTTFIARPWNIATEATYDFVRHPLNPLAREVSFMDVPRYYKGLTLSIPNAWVGAKESYKQGLTPERLDMLRGSSAIESLRMRNAPKILTVVGRFMEAADKFNSTLIASGEKTRLMSHGIGEETANKKAIALAQEFLARQKLGEASKTDPAFVRALDALGQGALGLRHLLKEKAPPVGHLYSWMLPFITTPINISKLQVKHSPLGFIGGNYSRQQLAQATTGSIITGIGALLAMQGKTTWLPPTDRKEKELFYAEGHKPYSVNIAGRDIPLITFGIYGLALAIPAAIKYRQDQSRESLTDSQIMKLTKSVMDLSKFVSTQTPLRNVGAFFEILDGEVDRTLIGQVGFTATQAIPLSGFLRWVNQIIDPVYRKTTTLEESILSGIPGLSQQVPPHLTPTGEPSKRELINAFLPYATGKPTGEYESLLQQRTKELQENAVSNKLQKDFEEGKISEITPEISKRLSDVKKKEIQAEFVKLQVKQTGESQEFNGRIYYYDQETDKVESYSIVKQEYDNFKAQYDLTAQRLKEIDDYEEWVNVTQQYVDYLKEYKKTLTSPTETDDVIRIQNTIEDKEVEIAKYKGYGGFKRGRKPKKISIKSTKVPTTKISFKLSKPPKPTKAKIIKTPTATYKVAKIPKFRLKPYRNTFTSSRNVLL